MYRFIVLLLLLSVSSHSFAQDMDAVTPSDKKTDVLSPDTASIFYTTLNYRWSGETLTRQNDSVLTGFNYFLPTEGETELNALTGNSGLAYRSLVFSLPEVSGFRLTPFTYDSYRWHNYNIRYFHTTGPYTNLFYSTGPAKEQLFNVTHSQNILGGLTLGLELRIVNSLGLYDNQKADDATFAGTVQYLNPKENYTVLANYHNTRLNWKQNGGISKEDYFTTNYETDRQRIPVFMENAKNTSKEHGAFVRQSFYFVKKAGNIVIDSLKGDTLGPKRLHRYFDPQRSNFIRHTFTFNRYNYTNTDNDRSSGFYRNYYQDSLKTYDSLRYDELKNDIAVEAGVGRVKGTSNALMLRVGIEHTAVNYTNDSLINRKFNYITPYASLSANAFGLTKVEGRIWTVQGQPFNGDKGIEGIMLIPGYDNTERWGNLRISARLSIEQPYYLFQSYSSNHFIWENSFGQQTTLSLKAAYEHKFFSAGFNAFSLTDYVYLNRKAIPTKETGTLAVTQIWAYTDIRWRHIESQIYGVLQTSSDQSVISLPAFAGRMSVCYSRALFKRALHFQGGVTALYNTAYFADAYMPALRAFYVQGYRELGNYPYLDAFVNIRVKRARMFLIMKHVNSGLLDYNYFMVPGYPMPDRGLRFGISWAFYD